MSNPTDYGDTEFEDEFDDEFEDSSACDAKCSISDIRTMPLNSPLITSF